MDAGCLRPKSPALDEVLWSPRPQSCLPPAAIESTDLGTQMLLPSAVPPLLIDGCHGFPRGQRPCSEIRSAESGASARNQRRSRTNSPTSLSAFLQLESRWRITAAAQWTKVMSPLGLLLLLISGNSCKIHKKWTTRHPFWIPTGEGPIPCLNVLRTRNEPLE